MAEIQLSNVNKALGRDIGLLSGIFGSGSQPENRSDIRHDRSFSLKDINLTIPNGKTMVILGPSGCGKSTLLRLVAGILLPDSGSILFDGTSMANAAPEERRIGMIFQDNALYPHMTSRENILSWFRFRKQTPDLEIEARKKFERTSRLLDVKMEHLLNRKPPKLSGGEKQRVAIGRCITRDPKLFLLDEPFSHLDRQLREEYRAKIKQLLAYFGITTILVTHDHREALSMGDVIAVMGDGTIEQSGTYREIYLSPATLEVGRFLSLEEDTDAMNALSGENFGYPNDVVGFRPEDCQPVDPSDESSVPRFSGEVSAVTPRPLGKGAATVIRHGEQSVSFSDEAPPRSIGSPVTVAIHRFHVFDKGTGLRVKTIDHR